MFINNLNRKYFAIYLPTLEPWYHVSCQLCSMQDVTLLSYSLLCSWYNCAALLLAGEFGFGSLNKHWIDKRMDQMLYTGVHSFCSISKQIVPSVWTFGWNIFETNFTIGGFVGYSSENTIISLNAPPSNGVSGGPKITAFQIIMLFSSGAAVTPISDSSCNLFKSLSRRWQPAPAILTVHTQ